MLQLDGSAPIVLLVDLGHLPPMPELAQAAVLYCFSEVHIGIGPNEVVERDGYWFGGCRSILYCVAIVLYSLPLPLLWRFLLNSHFLVYLVFESSALAGNEAPIAFRVDPRLYAFGCCTLSLAFEIEIFGVVPTPNIRT